jgi:hypothetical protein
MPGWIGNEERGDLMDRFVSRVRKPVRRERAETYLLYTLLSFASSVALTRLFLELTGYPQLGNSELHIAHVLWGGLLLFTAALLPLIFANRWVYVVGSILAGLGVGLFIDEVGKFITQTNDYFHPAAAPIVYAFFLLTVLVYLQVRRQPVWDSRSELYGALGGMQEVLDRDLEPSEFQELRLRIRRIAEEEKHPELARLAGELLEFLESEKLRLAPEIPSFLERGLQSLASFETRWVTKRRIKAVLAGGLFAMGVFAFFGLFRLLFMAMDPVRLEYLIGEWVSLGQVASVTGVFWFTARVTLEGFVGLLFLIASGLLIANRDRQGIAIGYIGLLLSLAAINLMVFFFEQFSTIITASVQFGLLLLVFYFRRRYLAFQTVPSIEGNE